MSDKGLTAEAAAQALLCCSYDDPGCKDCPARDLPYCHRQVKLSAAQFLLNQNLEVDRKEV